MVSLRVKEVFCLTYSVLLILSSLLLIGFSVASSYKIFYNFKFFPSSTIGPFSLLLILGIVHLLLTWLACKGATVKHDFHIILFLVITAVLFFTEFAIGVWNIVLWNNVDLESVTLLTESFEMIAKEKFHENSAWSRLQKKLKCCGLNGLKDFQQTTESHPIFCCDNHQGLNITCFDIGCRQPLADYTRGIMFDGILMSFLSSFLQAFGVFLFFSFLRTLRRERDIKSARRLALQKELAEHTTPLTQPVPHSAPIHSPLKDVTPKSSKKRSSKSAAPLSPPAQEVA